MLQLPIRSLALLAAAGLSLSACSTYGLGYGGGYGASGASRVSIGYGSGGYYSPYYGGYGRPYYGSGFGWYDGFYYPGYGGYIYNRHGGRHSWNTHHRRYWQGGGIGSAGHGGFVGLPHGFGSRYVGIGSGNRPGHSSAVGGSHRSSGSHRSVGHISSGRHGRH